MLPGFLRAANRNEFCVETIAIINAMASPPAYSRLKPLDTLIRSWKTSGVWPIFDGAYDLAAHDQASSLINWKAPGSFNLSIAGTPTFAANQGWTGNGTDGLLNSGFVPSTAGGAYSLDSAHLSCWVRTTAEEAIADIGANVGTTRLDTNRPASLARVNDGTNLTFTATAPKTGFFIAKRTAADAKQLRRNAGVDSTSATTASTSRGNSQFRILGGNADFCTKQLSFASIGGGMTDAMADNDFYPPLVTYLTAIGAI